MNKIQIQANIDIPKVPAFSASPPMVSSSSEATNVSGMYFMVGVPQYNNTLYNSILYYNSDTSSNKLPPNNYFISVNVNYVNKNSIPFLQEFTSDKFYKENLDLPFVFPLLLNDLTKFGIKMSANADGVDYKDINFFTKQYSGTPGLFNVLNSDAYNAFYTTNATDIDRKNVDVLNYNMQYCTVTTEMLFDYTKSQSNWINYSNKSNQNIKNKIPDDFEYKYFGPSLYQQLKGSLYSKDMQLIAMNMNSPKKVFIHAGVIYKTNPNILLLRRDTSGVQEAYNLHFTLDQLNIKPLSLGLYGYSNGGNDYLFVTYVSKINMTKKKNGVAINDIGTYPMMSGNFVEYINQSLDYSNSNGEIWTDKAVTGSNDVNSSEEYIGLNYEVPMIAKYKINYTDATNQRVSLSLVDAAALNQFIINTRTSNGNYVGQGNMANKDFVKAPFSINTSVYNSTKCKFVKGLSVSYQTSILDSVLDSTNNIMLCCYSLGGGTASGDIQYNPQHKQHVNGYVVALNIYDLNLPFPKTNPKTHILISQVLTIGSLQIRKHNNDYYVSIGYSNTPAGAFVGEVYKLVYNPTTDTITSFTKIYSEPNVKFISIQGVKNGDME